PADRDPGRGRRAAGGADGRSDRERILRRDGRADPASADDAGPRACSAEGGRGRLGRGQSRGNLNRSPGRFRATPIGDNLSLVGPVALNTAADLLERTEELALLAECLDSVRREARGRVVLVSGEAGVGKTALLRRFCDEHGSSVRILW